MTRSIILALLVMLTACGGEPAFCTAYDGHLEVTKNMDEAGDGTALRAAADQQRTALDALRAGAPSELLDDVDEVIGLWDRVLGILDRYDYDAERLVNEASTEERRVFLDLDAAGGPQDDATRIVQDWVRANCPTVSVPPPPSFSPVG